MNILLFALGSHGDVHPFVGIGIRLRERGHRVTVVANGYFAELVEHADLEFLELGTAEEYRTLATNRDLWHPLRGPQSVFAGTARYLRPMYDLAIKFAQRGDVVMAASSLSLGARVAQDKLGFPLATVHLSPSVFQSIHQPPKLPALGVLPSWTPPVMWKLFWRGLNAMADGLVAPSLNALRGDVGLPPVRGVLSDYWHSPDRVIGMFPDWFAKAQEDWPPQTVLTGFPLFDEPDLSPISPELGAFLQAGDAPIAFTPGSAMWQGKKFFEICVGACVKLGRRGLLLSRHRDHLPPNLPSNVMHVHYAPFSTLLPRCAAFVHHGGIGSSAQALASGVPQLVTPFTHDQPDNAGRMRDMGVAKVLTTSQYTVQHAARTLRELIESERVKRSCQDVAAKFVGVDAIGQTCGLIEALHLNAARRA